MNVSLKTPLVAAVAVASLSAGVGAASAQMTDALPTEPPMPLVETVPVFGTSMVITINFMPDGTFESATLAAAPTDSLAMPGDSLPAPAADPVFGTVSDVADGAFEVTFADTDAGVEIEVTVSDGVITEVDIDEADEADEADEVDEPDEADEADDSDEADEPDEADEADEADDDGADEADETDEADEPDEADEADEADDDGADEADEADEADTDEADDESTDD